MSTAIKYGVIGGVILIAYSLLLYILGPDIMAQMKFSLLSMVLMLVIMVIGGMKCRTENGGFLEFKDAFLRVLVIGVVSALLSTIFSVVIFNVVDPEVKEVIEDTIIENNLHWFDSMPEGERDKQIADLEAGVRGSFDTQKLLVGFATRSLIIIAVLSGIIALIVKRNRPIGE